MAVQAIDTTTDTDPQLAHSLGILKGLLPAKSRSIVVARLEAVMQLERADVRLYPGGSAGQRWERPLAYNRPYRIGIDKYLIGCAPDEVYRDAAIDELPGCRTWPWPDNQPEKAGRLIGKLTASDWRAMADISEAAVPVERKLPQYRRIALESVLLQFGQIGHAVACNGHLMLVTELGTSYGSSVLRIDVQIPTDLVRAVARLKVPSSLYQAPGSAVTLISLGQYAEIGHIILDAPTASYPAWQQIIPVGAEMTDHLIDRAELLTEAKRLQRRRVVDETATMTDWTVQVGPARFDPALVTTILGAMTSRDVVAWTRTATGPMRVEGSGRVGPLTAVIMPMFVR